MKKQYLLIIINLLFIKLQGQNFQWAKREGLWAYDYGYGITTDNSGNIYVAGKYEKNAKFSGTTVPCQGNHDSYVAKYSPAGALIWVRTSGGYTGDYATCVATDNSYVYVAGEIQGTNAHIKFIGSSISLTCKGSNDIFLAKYDLNGNLLWARRAGDSYHEKALGVSYDGAGNIYICGLYNKKAVFGGSTTINGYGENDIFIAKYDKNGNFQWVRHAGSSDRDEAKAIKCDAAGNVYVCGLYSNGAKFGSTTLYSPNGKFNLFLAKYSSGGSLIWLKTAGGNYDDVAWSLTMDNAGKIYVTGEFNSTIKFDNISLTTSGSADVFVACYNSSGNAQWAKKAGGNSADRARGIGTDGNKIFITGQFGGTASFGSVTKTAKDNSDIFMSCLSNSGSFLWTTTVGGKADAPEDLGYESGIAICGETNGNVYATGALLDGGVFGNITLNPYTRTDVFVTKMTSSSGKKDEEEDESTALIAAGSSWKYLDDGTDQRINWKTNSYDDVSWKTGNTQLGYGNGNGDKISFGPSSSGKYITTYFRKTFDVAEKSLISGLELSLMRDDGAVVYINGTEVRRSNMPSGTINYNTLASTSATSSESEYETTIIPSSVLVNGTNLIAVEIHQHSLTSPDMSFDLKLNSSDTAKIEDAIPPATDLLSFSGILKENGVYLTWVTSNEMNNDYFIIESSTDEENFSPVDIVMGAGNSAAAINYSFVDSLLSPLVKDSVLYYRLNQTDYDGKATYSSVIAITPDDPLINQPAVESNPVTFAIYPNPEKHAYTLSASEIVNRDFILSIYDITGKIMNASPITSNQSQIDVSSFAPGTYLVEVKSENTVVFVEKIIIQQ